MAALRIALPIFASLVLGLFIGTQLTGDASTAPSKNRPIEEAEPAEEDRSAALSLELESAKKQIEHLQKELVRALKGEDETGSGAKSIATRKFQPGESGARVISDLSQAEAFFEQAFAAGDLEAMWLLAADVLAFGEAGFPIFEELFSKFFEAMREGDDRFRTAFRNEELWVGRFLRTLAEQHEDFLAYGLHLQGRDRESLHPALGEIQKEMFDDDFLPVILAFHGGENTELLSGWLDVLESKIDTPNGVRSDAILYSLAQIPDDRAVDLIARWIEGSDSNIDDAISALIAHGSARALQVARTYLYLIPNEEKRAALEEILGP